MSEPTEPRTVMAEAFARAGMEQPQVRLRRMMRDAIKAGGGRYEPSRDYFIAALAKANDAALLWELFARVREEEISVLFITMLAAMRADKALQNAAVGADAGLPQGQMSDVPTAAPNADGMAKGRLPQGQREDAVPSAHFADAKATPGVPQGHPPDADASAPSSEDHEASKMLPQGHALDASSSEQQLDDRAKKAVPSGHSAFAPSPAAVPTPREPSQAAINAMIRVAQRHAAYDFKITVGGKPMNIGDIRVSDYTRIIQETGKRAWTAGLEFNLMLNLRDRADKQAFLPPRATTRDIFSAHEVQVLIDASRKVGELPVVVLPKELAASS